MAKRFCKADIQRHTDGWYGTYYPAVNVKVYKFPSVSQVEEAWPEIDKKTAEKALEYAWENACERFWEEFTDKETLEYYFPNDSVRVYSTGRSGGWLIVQGLPPVEEWDAIRVAQWGRFVKAVKSEVDYLTSWEQVKEDIEANEYYKPYSSRFNFYDTDKGTVCLADARADVMKYAEEKFDGAAKSLVLTS